MKYWFEIIYIFILVLIIRDNGGSYMSDALLTTFAEFLVIMFIVDLYLNKQEECYDFHVYVYIYNNNSYYNLYIIKR